MKRRYAGVEGGARGFTPFGVEHAKDNPTPDLKEFWHVGQELPPERMRAAIGSIGRIPAERTTLYRLISAQTAVSAL